MIRALIVVAVLIASPALAQQQVVIEGDGNCMLVVKEYTQQRVVMGCAPGPQPYNVAPIPSYQPPKETTCYRYGAGFKCR